MAEFYPMPMFVKLNVRDLEKSVKWYREAVGFEAVFVMQGMAHLRGAKYQDVMLLAGGAADEEKGIGVVINFSTDDIESLADQARNAKAEIVEGPVIRPWNAKELVIQDIDGYIITFSAPIDIHKKFDEAIDGIR
ncbi:VOC family protein [Paenibacillus contaminans]|uniref:Glyoxalase/bleomycin resistance/extradiol dioxygenase family protein n=1 Tax=Paenibacillus contaminans TaxID=450362 RepID=A0A329LQT9_9BACL|nr:VOC family protein [Paenibacillus contaminans]RAV10129.1 glyoxalase/bleomycin resistance/extradiol dioxygenase family protein [Paenibacillus contaminans]